MKRFMNYLSAVLLTAVSAGVQAQKLPTAPTLAPCLGHGPNPLYAQKVLGSKKVNGKVQLILGPKVFFSHNEFNVARSTGVAYDNYEYIPGTENVFGIPPDENPGYSPNCALAGARWWYGDTADQQYYNDMTLAPGTAGKLAQRYATGASLHNGTTYANFAMIIYTCENYDPSAPGDVGFGSGNRGDLTGWSFSYGAQTGTGGWYIWDFDTTDFGGTVNWQLPVDGSGGYVTLCGDLDTNTGTLVESGQTMLWGTKPTGNPSYQDLTMFLDANLDGIFDSATEYYGWDFGLCPDPLGSMAAFFVDNAQPVTLAPTSFTVGLGSIVSGDNNSLAADDANALKLCKAFVPNQTSPRIRFDANFTSPFLTPSALQLDLKARMTTGGAFKVRAFLADVSGTDTFNYGVANQVIADTTINLTFANYSSGSMAPGTHVDTDLDTTPDGTVRARVEIQQTGFSAVAVPCSEFEFLNLTVTP